MHTNFNCQDLSHKTDCRNDHDPCGDCDACQEYAEFCTLPDPGPTLVWNLHFLKQAALAVG
jgi:hypothetical protein